MRPPAVTELEHKLLEAYNDRRRDYVTFKGVDSLLALQFEGFMGTDECLDLDLSYNYNSYLREITVRFGNCLRDFGQEWLAFSCNCDWDIPMTDKLGIFLMRSGYCKPLTGIYSKSRKKPDFALIPPTSKFPTIVLESGYSEPYTKLVQGKDLWMDGTSGQCQVVIILKSKLNIANNFECFMEIWRRGEAPNYIQIFPEWKVDNPFVLLSEAYGGEEKVPDNSDPNSKLYLSISDLRRCGRRMLKDIGWEHA